MKGWQVFLIVVACGAAAFVGAVAGTALGDEVAAELGRRRARPKLVPVP